MTNMEIVKKIEEISKEVFEDGTLVITEDTTAEAIPQWDSLNHLTLIYELEEAFDIAFSLDESNKCKSVKDLVDVISNHIQ